MSEKILVGATLLVAVLATVPAVAEAVPYTALALVVLGIASGVMNGDKLDVQHRTAYYVLAAALPMAAVSLDVIPAVGVWLHALVDGLATAIQGTAVALVLMQVKARLMA